MKAFLPNRKQSRTTLHNIAQHCTTIPYERPAINNATKYETDFKKHRPRILH